MSVNLQRQYSSMKNPRQCFSDKNLGMERLGTSTTYKRWPVMSYHPLNQSLGVVNSGMKEGVWSDPLTV